MTEKGSTNTQWPPMDKVKVLLEENSPDYSELENINVNKADNDCKKLNDN